LPRKLDPKSPVSKQLEAVILRSMEREPAKRYQNAEDMLEALKLTPEGQRQGPNEASSSGVDRPKSGSAVDEATRAETSQSKKRARPGRSGPIGVVAGALLGAAGTIGALLYTPIGQLLPSTTPRAQAERSQPRVEPRTPVRSVAPPPVEEHAAAKPAPTESSDKTLVASSAPPAKLPVADEDPGLAQPEGASADKPPPPTAPASSAAPAANASAAVEDEDEDPPPGVKIEDGSGEDDRSPPPVAPAALNAVHREMPQVRSIADVKALLRKGDPDGALAGLYRLRQKKPSSPRASAEIATLIGNIYFDRHWWTDALKEYRFACRQDPHFKNESTLVNNTVRTMLDHGTYWRARRLILDYIGKSAAPSLRRAARDGQTPDLRRRAQRVLESLEGRRTASRSHR